MPIAAKMASSSVGGSRRTRRGPYLVFQSWLIGASLVMPKSRSPHVALQYEIGVAVQPCILTPTCSVDLVFPGFRLPSPSNGARNDRKLQRLLGPALQRSMSGIGQHINAALGAVEPAINIVQQNFARVRNCRLEIAHPLWSPLQRRRASQRLLAIGRHDRGAGAAAHRGVALTPPMFGDQT